jgi:hypothetical protein
LQTEFVKQYGFMYEALPASEKLVAFIMRKSVKGGA